MYQAKSGVKKFSLYCGGGAGRPLTKNFFPVRTCIKPNLVSNIFPLLWGGSGAALDKKFIFGLNMYQAKSSVKNFSLYCGGGRAGRPSTKNFFPGLNMYQAKSGVKNFSLYCGGGRGRAALDKIFFSGLNMYQAKSGVKNFSLYCGGGGAGAGRPLTKNVFPV